MTLCARLFGLFPALWLVASSACALYLLVAPGLASILGLIAVLYLMPVAIFRLHNVLWPLVEGSSRIDAPGYSPWWGGHQCQVMYSAFPVLEAALRLVPGLYSMWLRLWGSRVGHGVHWTPRVDISDRSLLEIGDGVVFGHRVGCYSHLVKRRGANLILYVRRIRIGDGVLLGAGSRLAPGTRVEDGAELPLLSYIRAGQRIRKLA
jgi:hypothetical protein